jgi:hypothetical protein
MELFYYFLNLNLFVVFSFEHACIGIMRFLCEHVFFVEVYTLPINNRVLLCSYNS